MKINILHISTATSFRGGEQQVSYLLRSLQNHMVKQVLICPKQAPLIDYVDNRFCNVVNYDTKKNTLFSAINNINKVCNSEEVHIIHAHDSKAHTSAVLTVLKNKLNVKLVVTRRVLFPVSGYLSKLKYKTSIVNSVICISKSVQNEMLKVINLKKTRIISSAIDLEKFTSIEGFFFPFFKDKNIRVGYVAALTPEKDHITFLKTAQLILKKHQNITFYIIGEGKLMNNILILVKKMNLQNNVVLTGFVKDIPNLIPQLDFLLFTSKLEGLGTTILDFYLAKKPVVTTLCGGNNEISLHNKTAMVSKVGDYKDLAHNFISLFENPDLRETIVNNAYNLVVKNFSLKDLGKNTFNEYEKVIK